MPYFNSRSNVFNNVITFPATKTAGTAVTYSSPVFSPSVLAVNAPAAPYTYVVPTNTYKAVLVLHADDLSKVTNDSSPAGLPFNLMGSWDGGTTWIPIASTGTLLANGSGATTVKSEITAVSAPMLRVDAVFDTTGALASGHGVTVGLVIVDDADQSNRKMTSTNLASSMGAVANSGVYTSSSFNTPEGDMFKKLYVNFAITASKVTLGNGVTLSMESSIDGTNWFAVALTNTAITATALNATTTYMILNNEVVSYADTSITIAPVFVGSYVRFKVTCGSTAAVATTPGTVLNVTGLY